MSLNFFVVILICGFAPGLNRASWGAYKDSPFENFKLSKYLRSILLSMVLAVTISGIFLLTNSFPPNLIVLVAVVAGLDTIITEIYKLFVRKEDQSKYKIPSRFNALGNKLNDFDKNAWGIFFSTALIALIVIFSVLSIENYPTQNRLLNVLATSLFTGILQASSGAWKDAPFERFNILKFFRTPLVSLTFGFVISLYTNNLALIFLSIGGLERMSVEFYKTYVSCKIPGKFRASKPSYKRWLKLRKVFIFPYILSIVLILGILLANPRS